MVERERSEESVPFVLCAEFFSSAVLGENGDSVSAGRPQSFEAATKQVFDNVTVVRVQGHPGALLMVVHSEFRQSRQNLRVQRKYSYREHRRPKHERRPRQACCRQGGRDHLEGEPLQGVSGACDDYAARWACCAEEAKSK